jgi:hypothetical protein
MIEQTETAPAPARLRLTDSGRAIPRASVWSRPVAPVLSQWCAHA